MAFFLRLRGRVGWTLEAMTMLIEWKSARVDISGAAFVGVMIEVSLSVLSVLVVMTCVLMMNGHVGFVVL